MSVSFSFHLAVTIQGSREDIEKLPSVVRQIAETQTLPFWSNYKYNYKSYAEDIAVPAEKALADGLSAFEVMQREDDFEHCTMEIFWNYLDKVMPGLAIILCCSNGDADYVPFPATTFISPPGRHSLNLREDGLPPSRRQDDRLTPFQNCEELTCLRFPNAWWRSWTISAGAFKGCVNLTDLILPDNVTKIAKTAFKDCKNLTIHAPSGSYVEAYAKEREIPFQTL